MRLLGVFRFLFLCLFGLFSCIFFSASLFRLLHGFARSSSRTPYATKPLLIPYGIKSGTEYNNNKSIGMRLQLANQHAAMFNVLNSYFTANAFAHTQTSLHVVFRWIIIASESLMRCEREATATATTTTNYHRSRHSRHSFIYLVCAEIRRWKIAIITYEHIMLQI